MTEKEAIGYLTNDWFVALSGQVTVDADKKERFLEALGMGVEALRAQQKAEKEVPLTQDQLRTMNCEIVYCLELNANVKVLAPRKGFIEISYELPGSRGTFMAKDVTLYRIC